MTPTTEHEILESLRDIKTMLVGIEGQPSTGFISRTELSLATHEKRIGSIEKWMWRCVGAGLLATAVIEFWRH